MTGGRAPRAAIALAIVTAFFLGVLVGPVAGVERRTVILTSTSSGDMRRLVAEGWTVARNDHDVPFYGTLLTLERPRLLGLIGR